MKKPVELKLSLVQLRLLLRALSLTPDQKQFNNIIDLLEQAEKDYLAVNLTKAEK